MPARGSHGVNTRTGHETVDRLGGGARWCKFARPVLTHERVVQPRTTQTSLSAFFKRG